MMISYIDGVSDVAPTAELSTVHAYRTDLIPAVRTGSLAVRAADARLLSTLEATLADG
jgi:hypothetical protein